MNIFILFVENVMLREILNFEMVMILLILVVVIIRVGIFLFNLKFCFVRFRREGIMIVGEMVERINLKEI